MNRRTTIVYRIRHNRIVIAGIFYGGRDIAARMRNRG
jgi:hypothetical protein